MQQKRLLRATADHAGASNTQFTPMHIQHDCPMYSPSIELDSKLGMIPSSIALGDNKNLQNAYVGPDR